MSVYFTLHDIGCSLTDIEIAPATRDESDFALLQKWTDVACLTITQLASPSADIQIGFYSYDHGDGIAFDGPLGVLGHTFYPTDGRVHFDDSETWTDMTTSGKNGDESMVADVTSWWTHLCQPVRALTF